MTVSFLKLHEETSAASNFSSAVSALQAFTELKKLRALLEIRLQLKGMLWLVWYSLQTTRTVSISAVRLLSFLIIPGSRASIKNVSFAFTTGLTGPRGLLASFTELNYF